MIEFKNVNYIHVNGIQALKEINLSIKPKTINALVGSNGTGKTTLARHINGLLKPTSGNVLVFGKNTKKISVASLSKRIGMVFQNSNHQLFADTVKNEILFGLNNFETNSQIKKNRFEWALNFFDLKKYENTSPLKLSGGEKKRLCIASVLAWNPEVLILDEPTVGQDQVQKEKMLKFISNLNKQGKTIIIISHDLEFLWPLKPNTIVMAKGRIKKTGKMTDIFSDDELLNQTCLMRPQLLDLWMKLNIKEEPPGDITKATDAIRRINGS